MQGIRSAISSLTPNQDASCDWIPCEFVDNSTTHHWISLKICTQKNIIATVKTGNICQQHICIWLQITFCIQFRWLPWIRWTTHRHNFCTETHDNELKKSVSFLALNQLFISYCKRFSDGFLFDSYVSEPEYFQFAGAIVDCLQLLTI